MDTQLTRKLYKNKMFMTVLIGWMMQHTCTGIGVRQQHSRVSEDLGLLRPVALAGSKLIIKNITQNLVYKIIKFSNNNYSIQYDSKNVFCIISCYNIDEIHNTLITIKTQLLQ